MNYGLDRLKEDMPQLVRDYMMKGTKPAMSQAEFKIFMNIVELFRTMGIPAEQITDEVVEQMTMF